MNTGSTSYTVGAVGFGTGFGLGDSLVKEQEFHAEIALLREEQLILKSKLVQYQSAAAELTEMMNREGKADDGGTFKKNRVMSCDPAEKMVIERCFKQLRELASR